VGTHTAQVLTDLGYTPDEINAMDASGAIYVRK